MAAMNPNFFEILTDTIERSGVMDDSAARADIYARARRTVVERARANGLDTFHDLESQIDAAIARIEAKLGAIPNPSALKQHISVSTPQPATGLGQSLRMRTATQPGGEQVVMAQNGNAALAVSVPEPDLHAEQDMAAPRPIPAGAARPDEVAAERAEEAQSGSLSRLKENVFPIWRKLKVQGESPHPVIAAPDHTPATIPQDRPRDSASRPLVQDIPPQADPATAFNEAYSHGAEAIDVPDFAIDSLDRVASDIAAGFRDLDSQFGAESSLESKPTAQMPSGWFVDRHEDEIALSEPDEALIRDVGNLVEDSAVEDEVATAPEPSGLWQQTRTQRATKRLSGLKLPHFSGLRSFATGLIGPNALVAIAIASLTFGTALYFTLNPQPADPRYATAASLDLIPNRAALGGEGWVGRDVSIEPAAGLDWNGFQVSDTADSRFGTLAAPLNDISAPDGFKIGIRLQKSDQRLPHFASLRVTAPYSRRAYTMDAMIDLTTGDIRAGGKAVLEDITVMDEGDSWRLVLNAPLKGNVLFSKPRLEIFPAAGTAIGSYDAAAIGTVVVGDITVEKL